MSRVFSQVLLAFCAVSLVLPSGWCCKLAWGGCCHPQTTTTSHQNTPPIKKYGCCYEPIVSANEGRAVPTPPNVPKEAPRVCCLPVDGVVPETTLTQINLPTVSFEFDLLAESNRTPRLPVVNWVASHSPPLHVLLCVWRC